MDTESTEPGSANRVVHCRGFGGCMAALLTVFMLITTGCQAGRANAIQRSLARQEVRCGERLLVEGKNDKAEATFRRAVRQDARNSDAHAYLGKIHAERGDDQPARLHYENALKYSPDNLNYALGLGDCLSNLATTSFDRHQLFHGAVKAYRHARSLDPENFAAALKLGICYRRMGDYDAAIKTLTEARRINPVSARAHSELAAAHQAIQELKHARTDPTPIAQMRDVTE